MELEYDFEKEKCRNIELWYCKTLTNNKEICCVCLTDEDLTKENTPWNRYELPCKHIAHTRCLRRWFHQKQKLNCPYCGNLEEIDKNEYCSNCEIWGHSNDEDKCPKMIKFIKEFNNW